MKKIFVFLLLMVVSFALKAQYPITQNLGSNNTLIRLGSTYGGALKGNLIQGVYADTTEANTGYIDLYPGAIIFSTGNATMYVRNAAADGWIALATGLSAVNIYTSDGALTGNRILSSVGYSLQFTGLSNFLVDDVVGELVLGTSATNRLRISSGFTAFVSLDADSLLMTRLPQSQLLSTDSVLVRTADFKVKTRAVSSIGSTYTAGNGLTLSGSQFKWGGTLDYHTYIDAAGFEYGLTDASLLGFDSYGTLLNSDDSITLIAPNIRFRGITTVSSTTGRKVALIDTATGKVERIDPATLVTTPTLQQVLTAGSTLTTNNEIELDGTDFTIVDNAGGSTISLVTTSGSISLQSLQVGDAISELVIVKDSITLKAHKGQINIDSLRTWSGISDTLYKKPMTWDTRNGRWEYAANWYGGGGGGSQDLQTTTDNGNTTTNWAQFGDSLVVEGADPQFHLYGSGFGYKLKANSTDKSLQFINGSNSKVSFIIDENGLVGINTLGPSAQLDVQDANGSIATGIFNAHEDRSGEIVNIQQAGTKKFSFHSNGSIELAETTDPTAAATGYNRLYAQAGKLYTHNDDGRVAQIVQDLQLKFGAGSGADADTTAFTTTALYGDYYTTDTIKVTSLRIVMQGTSPSVTVKIFYNDSLGVQAGATALVTAGNAVTNTTTGTNITSFDVSTIPPNVYVWAVTSTVGTKPKYLSIQLNGYRK